MQRGVILLLEDDQSRVDRFSNVLSSIAPNSQIVCWRSARTMIREVASYLPLAHLISLDHDLYTLPGDPEDPGDGLEVAKYLVTQPISAPIIIHSSNADRATMMAGEFELAGINYKVIAPLGSDWIENYWGTAARKMLTQQ